MTEKLYYKDVTCSSFTGMVLSCEEAEDRFAVILDKTAFFPEGGGQGADTGFIGDAAVSDVQEVGDAIFHYTDKALEPGKEYPCTLNWDLRFLRMQNHTGEHIISGTVHKLYGFENVGFHMGDGFCTADFDGELTQEQLETVERIANEAVWNNAKVTCLYPESKELPSLHYRSKLELTENVRLVDIEGYDRCACCAPHVTSAGQIGLIKILFHMRHRGGTRVHLACGPWAYSDYLLHFKNNIAISGLLSARQEDTVKAVTRILHEKEELSREILELKKQLRSVKLSAMTHTDGNRCLFEDAMDTATMRHYVNEALKLTGGICAAFSGSDEGGYNYIIAAKGTDMGAKAKEINKALCGRGGGRGEMIQGSVKCTRREIEAYFGV